MFATLAYDSSWQEDVHVQAIFVVLRCLANSVLLLYTPYFNAFLNI